MKKIFYLLCLAIPFSGIAQEKKEAPKYGISFSGFVKTDIFYDTRQTTNSREGHFLVLPKPTLLDKNKEDIDANPFLNMLSIQSRLTGAITGPDAFGAKTSGLIEADFFGNENAAFVDANGFRLRHAFVKLKWEKAELLAGQYWHPMFVTECFPGVISFNTGVPFQPFSRNPQLRFSYHLKTLSFTGTAFTQRDFTSNGPEGAKSSYLSNTGLPNVNAVIQFKPDSTNHAFGIGADYKTLTPRLFSTKGADKFKVDESIASLSFFGYAKLAFTPVTIKLQGVYAQNPHDVVMLGGYAVKEITDTITGEQTYTNLNIGSVWLDVSTNGKNIQYGLFAGYTKNLGATDSIKGAFYARGANVDYVYRLAPRVVFISGKVNIALEAEYTTAFYGVTNGNGKGGVTKSEGVSNLRGLLAFIYKF